MSDYNVYMIDQSQVNVLKRVKDTLYHNDLKRLSGDELRDLANTLDAILYSVEKNILE